MKKTIFLSVILIISLFSSCFALEINSQNAVLIEASTGRVIYEKNAHDEVPPASLTKILTAIMVLEKGNLNYRTTASYDAIMSVPSGASNTAIQVGEVVSIDTLLQCMLISSRKRSSQCTCRVY